MEYLQSFLSLSAIQSLTRAVLKVGGGYLLARGIAEESAIEALTAGAMALVAIIWGMRHRGQDEEKPTTPKTPTVLLLVLALTITAAGCASFNARAFHSEKLAADTAYASLSAWKSYYSVMSTNVEPSQQLVLSNQNQQVYAASRTLAAALYAVDELRERCVTNNEASGQEAFLIAMDVAAGHASNLVWMVKSFPK